MFNHIIIASDESDAINLISKKTGVSKRYLTCERTSEKKKKFGKSAEYEVTLSIDETEIIVNYINEYLTNIDLLVNEVGVSYVNNNVFIDIDTCTNNIVIGKNGSTLNALELLVRNYVNILEDDRKYILNVGGYKADRKKKLEILATKVAKEVASTGITAKLDNMNSYERRIVHTVLKEWNNIKTSSKGDEPYRYIEIKKINKKPVN